MMWLRLHDFVPNRQAEVFDMLINDLNINVSDESFSCAYFFNQRICVYFFENRAWPCLV